ncbi:MAG TPA: hypothetical protein VFY64_03875 [Nitrososphaeraceae archaeon]|nr:hypothetical protein [Nitrososphaeraceae archaeon]
MPLVKYEESNSPEGPESGVPEVAVCKVASLFVHMTVVPTLHSQVMGHRRFYW